MFYGGYEATLGAYPLALVYLCSVLVTYFGSLFVIFNGYALLQYYYYTTVKS